MTNLEAKVVGMDPEQYAVLKQDIIKKANENPQSFNQLVQILVQNRVPIDRFEALGWWKDLRNRSGR